MKSFKNFIISEEVDLTANVEKGVVDVHDHAVRNNINSFLNGELACHVVTPYVAFNKVNKVLANFHIFLPKAPYMEDTQGVHVFKIKQFGRVAGMRNDGSVVTKIEQPYSLYFEWKRNERGMFDVFAEIVTDEELADLLDAVEDDISGAGPDDDRDEKIYEALGAVGSTLAKGARFVPGLQTAIGLGMAGYRAAQGDYKGAGLSLGSAIPGPVGYGFAAADIARDVKNSLADSGENKTASAETPKAPSSTSSTPSPTSSSSPAKTPSVAPKVNSFKSKGFARPLSRMSSASKPARPSMRPAASSSSDALAEGLASTVGGAVGNIVGTYLGLKHGLPKALVSKLPIGTKFAGKHAGGAVAGNLLGTEVGKKAGQKIDDITVDAVKAIAGGSSKDDEHKLKEAFDKAVDILKKKS